MDTIQCPVCYGESAEYLGELAGTPYYRCTHCGIQWQTDNEYDALLAKLED
jgi:transposase-like protein